MSKLIDIFKKILYPNKSTAGNATNDKNKTTTIGYINKNNQKNIEKTNLPGNHYNQKLYRMECQICKIKYFANGSDIWEKKCPVCQGGRFTSTVMIEVVESLNDVPIGTELTRSEIVSLVNKKFNRNENSIIPSDYCYNRLNSGINYEKILHLFEYTSEKTYIYLGIDYPYTGKIYHNPKGGFEICVGELINGKLAKSDSYSTPQSRKVATQQKSLGQNNHKTKREIGLSLRYKILKRDNYKCCICGASPAKDSSVELHIDHILPWSKGGETTEENLQTLCSKCNLGKSNSI